MGKILRCTLLIIPLMQFFTFSLTALPFIDFGLFAERLFGKNKVSLYMVFLGFIVEIVWVYSRNCRDKFAYIFYSFTLSYIWDSKE